MFYTHHISLISFIISVPGQRTTDINKFQFVACFKHVLSSYIVKASS